MAAEIRHAGLTADERSDIRSTVLEARELIEDDLYRQLERYGVYEDERVDLDQLGHLDAYDRQTRRTIDAALDRELEATEGDYRRSVENYIREATKTYLNRLVALKAIEVRGLVTETLIKHPEYGNRSEMLRTVDEVAGELTEQQDGGLSASIELAYTELADEIGVIFEENEHTEIDLDFAVREEVIDELNELDESVWESDEAMGWVYQYFGEREREEIDDRIDEENYKVQDTDVATKTQLFTPRYIVEWMVDNSLGRLWLEMKGDETNINDEDKCFYLAPREDSLIDREEKNVRDIEILDPACGSGHMLFYAFDVLYKMYLEEGNVAEKYIPREILKNNLYGIDIDPGAAQLAALSLYVKAKSTEPEVEIDQINIISADAVLVNGEKKEEVLAQTDSELERRVLEQVWRSFEHIREWGSLVRIEERIEEIIDEELEEVQATGQLQFTDEGLAKQSSVITFSGEEESWEQVKERLLSQVSELAEEALERNDPIDEMFAGEVEKSVQLLDLFVGDYDVVVSNPPYLGSGKMDDRLKTFVRDNYLGKRDSYAAFIERCSELVSELGYQSMVTLQGFMFLQSYKQLRPKLLSNNNLIEFAHSTVMEIGSDQTVMHVLRKDNKRRRDTRFIRLVDDENKKEALVSEIFRIRDDREGDRTYLINQSIFQDIGHQPFVYWFGRELLNIFSKADSFEDHVTTQSGLVTGNNNKFLRKHWEVKREEMHDRYIPWVRSENSIEYYDKTTYVIDWKNKGDYIRNYCDEHGHQYFFGNDDLRGSECIGMQDMSKYFIARKIPEGFFAQKHFYLAFPEGSLLVNYLNGWLNSSLIKFIMDGLNPTIHFKQGDLKRLPMILPDKHEKRISDIVEVAISSIKRANSLYEDALSFDPEIYLSKNKTKPTQVLYEEEIAHCDRLIASGLIDSLIFDEYDISNGTQNRIFQQIPSPVSEYPHIVNDSKPKLSKSEFCSEIQTEKVSHEEYSELISKIDDLKDNTLREISEELEVSPYTVAMMRHDHDLYTRDEKRKAAGRLLSYYLGCVMGRWELKNLVPDNNGIIVFDSDFDDNVITYMRRCIELTYGEDELYKRENEIGELLNKDIEDWLRNTFFRYHHCKEYRRRGQRIPVYWQLESDDSAFSCFVYYHAMNADTLPKLRGQYIDKKLDTLQNRLEAIESELGTTDGERARELRSEKEEIEADIDDIEVFRDRVDELIDEGFEPDFEAGIWENIQKVDEHDLLAVPLDKL